MSGNGEPGLEINDASGLTSPYKIHPRPKRKVSYHPSIIGSHIKLIFELFSRSLPNVVEQHKSIMEYSQKLYLLKNHTVFFKAFFN
jgi:hypothetical protein